MAVLVDVLGGSTGVFVSVEVAVGDSLGVGDALKSELFITMGRKMPKGKVGVAPACAALVKLLEANAKQKAAKASKRPAMISFS